MRAPSDTQFRMAQDRLHHWRSVGAQVSPTVARLVKLFGEAASAPVDSVIAPTGDVADAAPGAQAPVPEAA
jgi:ribosomal protein S16